MNSRIRPISVAMRAFVLLCFSVTLINGNLMAENPPPPPQSPSQPPAMLNPEQIDSLVAPIALYPDELVSQILVASTYPLEIVQAYQWMQQHPDLNAQELTAAAQQQSWDASVQALVAFPDVMKRLNQDVTWTTSLGNAFLANQDGVMDEIQKMRARAQDAGKLKSTEQQNVVNTTDNGQPVVQIEPASPDVIYVPVYNPAWVWGPAPEYDPYPYWYYPPEPPVGALFWWGTGISMGSVFVGWRGWDGWGWHPGWHEHTVGLNQTFFVGNHFHESHPAAVWVHDPGHRIGVAYPNRTVAIHFNQPSRPAVSGRVTVVPMRSQSIQPAARVQTERFGSRQINAGGYSRNRTAFGGVTAGSAARTYSARGNSSLSHVQPAGSVHIQPSGGGGRGGGDERRGGGGHR